MARRTPPGTGMLRLSAAILFIAGPIVALVFWSWGLGVRPGGYRAGDKASPPWRASQRALPRGRALARWRFHRRRWLGTPAVGSITPREDERVILRTSS